MQKIRCWKCGEEATSTRVIEGTGFERVERGVSPYYRCYCEKCKAEVDVEERRNRELYIRLKKREMFIRACDILEKQHTKMYEYREAIEVVDEFISTHPDKFDSSYEVLAAIVLVHNRIVSEMQRKIGRYQVDFYLPDLCVVLEIDGERHTNRKTYDTARDNAIKKKLGPGWDIVRIKTDYLDKDAKRLPEAINKVIDYRQTGHIDWRGL